MGAKPTTSTKKPAILENVDNGDHFLAGGIHSFENQRLQVQAMLTKSVGNASNELQGIPNELTGWAFYNATPGTVGNAVIAGYIAGLEMVTIYKDGTGDFHISPGADPVNASMGGNSETWIGYFSTIHVATDLDLNGTLSFGTTNQGDILYDNGTSIVRLTPGTSGYFLKTQGAAANPVWAQVTDTLGSLSTTQGNITYANGSAWTVLGPGTSGQFLQTLGTGANPQWVTPSVAKPYSQSSTQGIDGTTLTASDTFIHAMGANEVWVIDCDFNLSDSANFNTEGIKFNFTGPSGFGGTIKFDVIAVTTSFSSQSTLSDSAAAGTGGSISAASFVSTTTIKVRIRGRITTSSTAGNLTFQWAKSTDTGASQIVMAVGSSMIAVRQ